MTTNLNAGIHVHDYGTIDQYQIRDEDNNIVNIAGRSLVLYYTRPDGSLLTKTPSLTTDGTDGLLQYTFASGDITQAGWWQVQTRVDTWYSTHPMFRVYDNIV